MWVIQAHGIPQPGSEAGSGEEDPHGDPSQRKGHLAPCTERGEMRLHREKRQSMQICLQSYIFSQYFMDPVLCGSRW